MKQTQKTTFPLILLFLSLLLASCSKEWEAEEAIVVVDADSSVVLVQERRFTLTSYSSEGGITRRGGYTHYFLNSYDLQTGEQIATVNTGKDYKEKLQFLALVDQKAWFFTLKDDLGFHARDPWSLEVLHTEADIIGQNPEWFDEFVWQEGNAAQYYRYLPEEKKILITGSSGQLYLFDPLSLRLQSISEKPRLSSPFADHLSARTTLHDSIKLSFQGELRQSLLINKDKFAEVNFLNPKFLTATFEQEEDKSLFEEKRSMIFVLSESKIGEGQETLLSAITLAPQVNTSWSIPLTHDTPEGIRPSDCLGTGLAHDVLVLAFPKKIFCVDIEQTQIRWEKIYE